MTVFQDLRPDDQRRLEEAAAWRLRIGDDPAAAAGEEWHDWAADPENRRALDAVEASWSVVGDLATTPQLLEMRRAALARIQRAEVARRRPRRLFASALAAMLLVGVAAIGGSYAVLRGLETYRTDIGERRLVPLPDGSRISMDADTVLRVHFSDSARAITLDHGRARFDVSHDVSRPFTVAAGSETVVAVGTSFDVERLDMVVLVTLIQGDVIIKNAASSVPVVPTAEHRPALSLSAGEQLVAAKGAKPVVAPTNLQTASAWEAGHLVFKDETLDQALARVNRYTTHPLSVDPSAAGIRISGVFNAGDVGAFVSAVTSYFPVQATTTPGDGILLQRKS